MNNNSVSDSETFNFKYYLTDFWRNFGDRRVQSFPMFSNGPNILIIILITYLALVTKVIPDFMKSREPFKLEAVVRGHNIVLVISNAFFFIITLGFLNYGTKLFDISIPSDEENSAQIQYELIVDYFYYTTRLIELLDTIFYALRKKQNKITFLHLYHHTQNAFFTWLAIWYRFNMRVNRFFALINSFVHFNVYLYCFLASFSRKIQRNFHWKKYIIQLELIQFVILGIYGVIIEILGVPYPKVLKYAALVQCSVFLYLFSNFYLNRYKVEYKKQL